MIIMKTGWKIWGIIIFLFLRRNQMAVEEAGLAAGDGGGTARWAQPWVSERVGAATAPTAARDVAMSELMLR